MVTAAELTRPLDRDDVLRLLDDTDHGRVAPWVTADPALFLFGDVAADGTEPHLVLDLDQRVGQPAHVDGIGGQQVERDPLSALGPDTGQPAQLVDEVLDDTFVHVRASRSGAR